MTGRHRWRRFALLVLVVLLVLVGTPPVQADTDRFGQRTPVMVVLDVSGSMDSDSGTTMGGTRMQAARSAVLDLIQAVDSRRYAMISYPGGPTDDEGCSPGVVQTELGALDVAQASADARRMTTTGSNTPTSAAMDNAADVLRSAGSKRGVIVLVSDGEANCGADPCETAKTIRSSGLDVVVNTVGFQVSEQGQEQLTCVADATGGRYTRVDDPGGLAGTLQESTQALLTATLTAPLQIPVAVGTGDSTATRVSASISNTGQLPAKDVRATLTFSSREGGKPGSVMVQDPVYYAGNVDVGGAVTATFDVRPDAASVGDHALTVTVTSQNAAPVARSQDVTVSTGLSGVALGPIFEGVERVAVMGDSYSSGEGTPPYLAGSASGESGNACHKTATTYGGFLWGDNATVIACSGAVTADFFKRGTSNNGKSVPTQLEQLRSALGSSEPPQAVLLSIGGNDAGFGEVGNRCVFGLSCRAGDVVVEGPYAGYTVKDYYVMRALDITASVKAAVEAVDDTINSDKLVAARGKEAPVVVLPYPRIVPESVDGVTSQDKCMLGLSGTELDYLNRYFDAVNTAVSLAAYQLHNAGRPVYVVPDIEDAFQPDHTICEGKAASWARYVTLDELSKTGMPQDFDKNELLHPTKEGHAAEAQVIASWSRGSTLRLPATSPTVTGRSTAGTAYPSVLGPITTPAFLSKRVAQAGAWALIQGGGFVPGSVILLKLHSVPVTLGTATADENGEVNTWAWIPEDVPVGKHTVELHGYDPDGNVLVVEQPLRIVGWGGPWLLLMLLGCAVLMLVGGVWSWREARRE